jgi:hypothetical protein
LLASAAKQSPALAASMVTRTITFLMVWLLNLIDG